MSFPRRETYAPLIPIVLAQGFGLLCGLAGVRLSSWLVPPGDFGRYGVFLTFAPLGMWVVHAGVIKFVSRQWADAPDRGSLLRSVIAAAWRKTPWLAVAAAVASGLIAGRRAWAVFPLVFLAAFLLSGGALAQTALQAARQHWRDLAVAATGSITRSFIPPLLYAAAGGTMFALYGGYCVHALAVALAGAWTLHAHWRPAGPPAARLAPTYEGPMFVVLSATGWILLSLGRWVMAACFGAEPTGYFVLAGNLAILVPTMLAMIFLQFRQPVFFAMASESPAQRRALAHHVDQTALAHTTLAILGLVALRQIAPWLIGPLISARYAPAVPWLLPTGLWALAITSGQFYHSLLLAGRRERACGPVELTAAVLLITGALTAAGGGVIWFQRWLIVSPLVPWLVNRPLARRYYFKPA